MNGQEEPTGQFIIYELLFPFFTQGMNKSATQRLFQIKMLIKFALPDAM